MALAAQRFPGHFLMLDNVIIRVHDDFLYELDMLNPKNKSEHFCD